MRSMSKENAALQTRVAEAERAKEQAAAETSKCRDELHRLAEQRDNLLLGAARAGHASSPADALVELLAAATNARVADTRAGRAATTGDQHENLGEWDGSPDRNNNSARRELESALEQARAEARAARVAAQQEKLRREGAAREKDEAVRQLHRLMAAARRAMSRKDSRLRSSRMETEVVWNALTEAVR